MRTINLYGEDGIVIYVSQDGDIETDADRLDPCEAWTMVIGHRLYACSLTEARRQIRDAYLDR